MFSLVRYLCEEARSRSTYNHLHPHIKGIDAALLDNFTNSVLVLYTSFWVGCNLLSALTIYLQPGKTPTNFWGIFVDYSCLFFKPSLVGIQCAIVFALFFALSIDFWTIACGT